MGNRIDFVKDSPGIEAVNVQCQWMP